jgi:hypothetical protein
MRRFDFTNIVLTAVLGFIYFSFILACVGGAYLAYTQPAMPLSNAKCVVILIVTGLVGYAIIAATKD